ncbi:MAG: hypothetical protein IT328_24100 [Caldilineaceae bacterium]|nr:hypothetical protein [Caldilineaceae bacterium]
MMPNYTVVQQKMTSYGNAAALLPKLQAIYQQCQEVDDAITLYMSGTNADFNAAINAIFTPAERAELAAMLENVQLLVTTWQAQHGTLLGGEPGA